MKTPAVTQRMKTTPILAVLLLALLAFPLIGQSAGRMWAAQTGPDQVTLSWDSIPGTMEYRIYMGAPGAHTERPPAVRVSASGRRAVLTGIQRLSNGVYMVAVDANGRMLQQARFNQVAARTTFAPVVPPAAVMAQATSPTEVTLSWSAAPGATGYFIGRAVAGSGFRVICDLCPTDTQYVDRSAAAGFPHSYIISAIFPNGISRRITSNTVTPGVAEVATTAVQSATGYAPMPGATTPTTNNPISGMPSGIPAALVNQTNQVTPGGTPAAMMPGQQMPTTTTAQTTNNQIRMMPSGVPVSQLNQTNQVTPGGTPAAIMPGQQMPTTTSQPATVHTATPVTTTPTTISSQLTEDQIRQMLNGISSTLGNLTGGITQNMTASTTTPTSTVHTATPVTATPATTTSTASPVASACKLDYQRADNMWAAFGHPDGPLGIETILLSPGQTKAFTTDWKYERTRNDGSNFYGSHLRIATNNGSNTIRLQTRALTFTGLDLSMRTLWIGIAPGSSKQFQADLMEVSCEN